MKKFKFFNHKAVVVSVLLMMLVMVTSVAYAITIVVDGVKEAAWGGEGGQIPGSSGIDNDEAGITDNYDVKEVLWTNDSTGGIAPYGNMYWLIETYSPFNADVDFATPPVIHICIDVDNLVTTGRQMVGYCNDMAGVDRRVTIDPVAQAVIVYRPIGINGWGAVATPAGGLRSTAWLDANSDFLADNPIIEIGVDLESLQITGGATCIVAMPAAVYFDNGIGDFEDNTPNSGTINMGCGTPTAVNLQTFSADSTSTLPIAGAVLAAFALVSVGIYIVRREQKQA